MVILPEDLVIFSDTASLRELDPFMKQDPEADLSGFYPAALQALSLIHIFQWLLLPNATMPTPFSLARAQARSIARCAFSGPYRSRK